MASAPDMRKLVATGLGTGYLPIAPGTWGSAAVVVLYLLAARLADGQPVPVNAAMIVLAAAAGVACAALGGFAERSFARRDPPQCTLDEWSGQAVALIAMPAGEGLADWLKIAATAFVAFRLFDIVKPPPARRLERLPGGWGILADDLVAGAYANAVSQVLLRLWLL